MVKLRNRENTEQEIKRGKATGFWIRSGLARKGWRIIDLSKAIGRSKGYLGVIINADGINGTTKAYQRPGEKLIEEIAAALDLDPAEGRRAAGYGEETSPEPQNVYSYTIGNFNGKPVIVTLGDPISEDQLNKLRFAASLTLAEYGGS